ncbi:uncharacterized protein LAJ45_09506 [Morchella importuna]|uniref:uncharacterized protein n=1 Tax=Morchella importuna TaxID=1174673 RepID=UPI001E8D2EC1|nr:uncharacterized protein LAJ45_09506 [Morchella importuna]KAH8146559.1 hypothetical protein LAJ45_09506 [Morchella importuna]
MNHDHVDRDSNSQDRDDPSLRKVQFSPPPTTNDGVSNGGGSSSSAGGGGGGSKRKRVSLACNACRTRKSKCDGVRPKCSMCRDLDFDCVYQQSASSSNTIVGKDYIGRLETRLLAVENLLAAQASLSLRNNLPQTPTDHSTVSHDYDETSHSPEELQQPQKRLRVDGPVDTNGGETFVNLRQGQLEDESSAPDTVLDGMGALNLGDEEDYGYFGPSSNIAFIGHVTRALATSVSVTAAFPKDFRRTESALEQSSATSTRFMSARASPAPLDSGSEFEARTGNVNIYVIPPRKRVLHYVTLYFQNTNILFPYLHQPSFLETYEEAQKEGFTKVRRTWLALLNLVMAMGSRASTEREVSAEEKYKAAEVFYQRGWGLCDGHFLRLASLDSVHLLLLMSHYLQSTRKPNQCWTTHGLAVRIALQLGLHSNQALQRFPPLERELRKRAWYGCVLLDRTLCMTFGRPSAITAYAEKLDLPLDVEDDVFKPNMSPIPPSGPTSTTFFILSIKLYSLLGSIIDTLYGGNLGGGDQPEPTFADVARVAEIEEKLSIWRQQLPSALTIVSAADIPVGGGPPSKFWRQSIILSLRYYNTRALLHRQFVVKGLSEIWGGGPSCNRFEGDFFWNFGWASIKVCAESAIETVEIVHKVKYRSDLLGFWWFTLYYTFNASLVLVSKVLILSQVRQLAMRTDFVPETGSLLKHLEMAMETIEVLAAGNRIANRCQLFLKNLMQYVAPLVTSSPRTLQSNPLSITYNPAAAAAASSSSTHAPPDHTSTAAATPTPTSTATLAHTSSGQPLDPGAPVGGYNTSPFRAQLGEFMLESDFTYLNSILPPLGMDMGLGDHEFGGEEGGHGQGGLGAHGGYAMGFSG